jgi:hypothetical protein
MPAPPLHFLCHPGLEPGSDPNAGACRDAGSASPSGMTALGADSF